MTKLRQLLKIRDELSAILHKAAKKRRFNPEGWIAYERQQMHTAVVAARAKLGKGPISLAEIERVEATAVGHTDYARKWSLYCAELVLKTK